jgi:hypothetical protein
LDRRGNERCVEEIFRIPLDQDGHITQLRVPTPIEPSLGVKRKEVPEYLGDSPSGSKFGDEVRFVANDLKGVRFPWRNYHLAPGLDDSRSAQALADAKCAVAYEKPFLLARVPVKRPSVATTTRSNLRPQEIPTRFEDYRVEIERGTVKSVTGRDRLAWLISGRSHRTPTRLAARSG